MTLAQDKAMVTIPDNIAYDEATASSEGAHYAYNFINKVKLSAGQEVLVNGATGAIGSALVQFLKYFEANVTAVCDTKNIELIRSLEADKVIDYTEEDFTEGTEQYDFIFDAVGKSSFGECKHLLKRDGIYVSSELGPKSQNPLLAIVTPILGGKKVIFPFPANIKRSLESIKDLMEREKYKPVIDRKYLWRISMKRTHTWQRVKRPETL